MKVTRVGDRWICTTSFEERAIPCGAGFTCSPEPGARGERVWYTKNLAVAMRLMTPQQIAAASAIESERYTIQREHILESLADDTTFEVPVPDGLVMRAYQRAGVSFSHKRRHTLNADDPGLGKTIQVAGLINCLQDELNKILILCPNSLRLNWLRELKKWLLRRYNIAVWRADVFRPQYVDISILHYDACAKWQSTLRSVKWDLVIADECHYLKNPATDRSRAVLGLDQRTATKEENARIKMLATYLPGAPVPKRMEIPIVPMEPVRGGRSVLLTGTPLPNRPKEIFPLLHYLDPQTFKSSSKFKKRYCGFSWDAGADDNGASNLAELQELLRSTVMIRRLKGDVLKELPPKQRCVIEIPHDANEEVAAELAAYRVREDELVAMREAVALAKLEASEHPDDYAAAVAKLRAATVRAFSEISKQRAETAVAKIPYVIDHLRNLLANGEKLIVFAHHHGMVEAVVKEFKRLCVTCYGPDSNVVRQANVDRFQQDVNCQLIVGTYGPMGTGWTLTASNHVVAAELDWVPGNMTQAEDRAHRMGQLNTVLVEHLVLEGSLDAYMARIVVEKQEVQAAALDMEVPPELPRFRPEEPAIPPPAGAPIAPQPPPMPVTGTPPPPAPPKGQDRPVFQQLDVAYQMNLLDPDTW